MKVNCDLQYDVIEIQLICIRIYDYNSQIFLFLRQICNEAIDDEENIFRDILSARKQFMQR